MPADPDTIISTDFSAFVIRVIGKATRETQQVDQNVLRQCLGLASSFLITDATMNPEDGVNTWFTGFIRLVDVVVALHAVDELELETVNAASKACSECWTAGGSWRGFEDCRDGVRKAAAKLKRLLDPETRTYKGNPVYAP